jgi:hypothetical protein
MSQGTHDGYDVRTAAIQTKDFGPGGNTPHKKPHNGRLFIYTQDGAHSFSLLISDFQTGFQLVGSTAQSVRTRSYFAHNIAQPSFVVTCQFRDQERYGKLIELIRIGQLDLTSSMRLYVAPYNSPNKTGTRMRGDHTGIYAEGYVKSVKRRHERFVNSPELRFEFIVERVISGPSGWNSGAVKAKKMMTWNDIIKLEGRTYQEDPDSGKAQSTTPSEGPITTDTVGGFREG